MRHLKQKIKHVTVNGEVIFPITVAEAVTVGVLDNAANRIMPRSLQEIIGFSSLHTSAKDITGAINELAYSTSSIDTAEPENFTDKDFPFNSESSTD